MKVAIIVNQYHTECVYFLTEIFPNSTVFYDTDLYGNDQLWNVSKKKINEFQMDDYDRIFVITIEHYFQYFSTYNEKFVWFIHNKSDRDFCKSKRLYYFALSEKLDKNYLLPFAKYFQCDLERDVESVVKILQGKKIILKLGWSLENNTDMNALKELENANVIVLFITSGSTQFISNNMKKPYIALNPSTAYVLNLIEKLGIKNIVFCPPSDRSEYSSTYQFAVDNNLKLHIPNYLDTNFPNTYKYRNVQDILENMEKKLDINKLNKFKEINYERNCNLLRYL